MSLAGKTSFRTSFRLLVLVLVLDLVVWTWAYPPACNIYYGRPTYDHCRRLIDGPVIRINDPTRGIREIDRDHHFFGISGIVERPPEISALLFWQKVNIPKFWSDTRYPNCRAVLLPVIGANGELSWDTGRWLPIGETGSSINEYCVRAAGMPGIVGSGGMEVTGDNQRLRIVLYAPGSAFERDTTAKYKAGSPLGVPDPAGIPEYETPQTRRKRPRPGDATADSAGSVAVRPKVQSLGSLGSGWYMKYDSITDILPPLDVAGALNEFYNAVTATAADQLGSGKNSVENLAFKQGSFSLQLSSQSPILWSWVINFAQSMIESLGPDFTPIFRGEAISGYWVLASVQVAVTLTG